MCVDSIFGVALNCPSSVWVRLNDDRQSYQVRQAASLQLLDNVRAMQFDRAETDAEVTRDDLVRLARSHEVEHLPLALCQQCGACLQLSAFQPPLVCPVIPIQRPLYAFEQRFLTQRFLDKIESAGLNRCNRQRNRALAGNKYYRNAPAANVELLLKFDPGHPRHLHIEQQASAPSRIVIFQKGRCRRKGFDRIPGGAQQECESFTHGRVIVDDEYCLIRHSSRVRVRLSGDRTRRLHRSRYFETSAVSRHATRRSSG